MRSWMSALLVAPCLLQPSLAQPLVFTDATFNLSQYSWDTRSHGISAGLSQTLVAGHPDAALEVDLSASAGTVSAWVYLLNLGFVYDPGRQGGIASVSMSADTRIQNSLGGVASHGQSFILMQGGQYYTHRQPVAPVTEVYQTASAPDLRAEDFVRITDLDTGATQATDHPSFLSGLITFGVLQGVQEKTSKAHRLIQYTDNFVVAISPVPEPAGAACVVAALALMRRQQRARSETKKPK